jgi:hypothetical protein
MIKALLLSIFLIILVIVISFIRLKYERNKLEKKIYHLLLEEYLGKSYESITNLIKKDLLEKIIDNGIESGDSYKYLFTHTRNKKTMKVYQFLNNTCTGFCIHSNEDRYSLPYWKHVKGYIDNYTDSSNVIPTENELLELAMYTCIKFIEPFEDTEECLDPYDHDDFYFRMYYRVGDHRYLSINAEMPGNTRFKIKAIYSYLCSSHPVHMKEFRQMLIDKPDILIPSLMPEQTARLKILEQKDCNPFQPTVVEPNIHHEDITQVEAE